MTRSGFGWLCAIVVGVGGSLAAFLLLRDPIVSTRRTSRQAQCVGNLRQIGIALHSYHKDWGSFPPAYVENENGERMYGWRTLILPYLDQVPLYNAYRFDEPWNGAANSNLYREGLPLFCCPSSDAAFAGDVSYVAVVGPTTAWPGPRPAKLDEDFPDGPADTILLIEVENSGIHWMEPRDLLFDEVSFTINDPQRPSPSSRHAGRASKWVNVLFADGVVKQIHANTAPEVVRAMLTAAGHESNEPIR